jgi:CTP synthase (UTP-ammonia lyase)
MVIATGLRIGIIGDYKGNNPTHVATTNGIQHASEALGEPIEAVWLPNNVSFIGTCGGFQDLVVEYARNVMGFTGRSHAESHPGASCLFSTPLSCSLVGRTMEVAIRPGSRAAMKMTR